MEGNEVTIAMEISPKTSVCQVTSQTSNSKSLVQRILRCNLRLTVFNVKLVQKLSVDDPIRRDEFCEWFLRNIDIHRYFLNSLLASDESTFQLNGVVNS